MIVVYGIVLLVVIGILLTKKINLFDNIEYLFMYFFNIFGLILIIINSFLNNEIINITYIVLMISFIILYILFLLNYEDGLIEYLSMGIIIISIIVSVIGFKDYYFIINSVLIVLLYFNMNIKNNTEEIGIYNNKVRALIVDDNEIVIKSLTNLLTKKGVRVEFSKNGQHCIDRLRNGEKYNLIFMDDMMPKMNGVFTLNNIKNNNLANVPIICITANSADDVKEKYLKYGFSDYLAKPIERDELDQVLNKFLKF